MFFKKNGNAKRPSSAADTLSPRFRRLVHEAWGVLVIAALPVPGAHSRHLIREPIPAFRSPAPARRSPTVAACSARGFPDLAALPVRNVRVVVGHGGIVRRRRRSSAAVFHPDDCARPSVRNSRPIGFALMLLASASTRGDFGSGGCP
jgi:hypothetical protein